jgi:hypothetical protein
MSKDSVNSANTKEVGESKNPSFQKNTEYHTNSSDRSTPEGVRAHWHEQQELKIQIQKL